MTTSLSSEAQKLWMEIWELYKLQSSVVKNKHLTYLNKSQNLLKIYNNVKIQE